MKVFIGGARSLNKLNSNIIQRLMNIKTNEFTILVGDANGIDKSIQKFYASLNYTNVIVYASNGNPRNNLYNWEIQNVNVPKNITGFDFYAKKDEQMAIDADYGFMIWNGKSRGTFNNIINLTNQEKKVVVYVTITKKFYYLSNPSQLNLMMKNLSMPNNPCNYNIDNIQLSFK